MFTRLITSAHKTGEGKGVGLISIRGKTVIAVLLSGKTSPGEQFSLGNRMSGVWTENV